MTSSLLQYPSTPLHPYIMASPESLAPLPSSPPVPTHLDSATSTDQATPSPCSSRASRCPPVQSSPLSSTWSASGRSWANSIVVKMMFVSGETAEPSAESTTLVEQIVQQQVKELVSLIPTKIGAN